MSPTLVASYEDGNAQAVLAFQWPVLTPTSGLALASYHATLWADAARSAVVSGGATQTVTQPAATFSGVPRAIPFLLDVTAVDTSGGLGPTISLLQVAPTGVLPGQPLEGLVNDPGGGEGDPEAAGVLAPLRPVYGTVDGVKRWAHILSFGTSPGQVSPLDVLYFLMLASDDADGELAARYAVPLTKYKDALGQWRYPPPVPGLIERKAAGLLLYARKAALTEQQSGTAVGLMTYADKKISQIAASTMLLGQTLMVGMLPQVYCPVPRNFSMAGDPAGWDWNPVVGSSDVRFLRPHGLAYVGVGWRYGGGAVDAVLP